MNWKTRQEAQVNLTSTKFPTQRGFKNLNQSMKERQQQEQRLWVCYVCTLS